MTTPVFSNTNTAPAATEPKAERTGTCPDCGGTAPVGDDGRIASHQQRIIRGGVEGGVEVDGDKPCDGAGQKPAEDQ